MHEAGLNGPEALIRGCVTLKVDRSVVLDGCDQNMTGRRENREMSVAFGFSGRWWDGGWRRGIGKRIGKARGLSSRMRERRGSGKEGKDGRWGDRGTEGDINE